MSENNFEIKLRAVLDKIKSIANIKSDIKAIEPKLPKVKIQGTLDKTATQKELNSKIKSIKPKVKVDADTTQAEKKIKKIGKQKNKTTITPTVDNTQVVSGLKQAQKETKTLWERFTSGIIGANLVRMAVNRVTQAIKEAIATVKELDTIKTNIQMVSGTSDSDVNAMMSSYNAMAKNLSSTTKDVAEAANEFLRMGESIQNTNELIRSSQILSKVGMIDSADAASYLISSLKGYQVEAENSIDIVSKLTSVDLEAAVSAGGLAEAISRCSNIANNSGTSMDRLIGYTAAVGEVTQESMSVIGNAFKSIYSRMNNIKIGKFIDDETGESLSDTEAVLNKLGIQLRDTQNSYRDFDEVLDDIGGRWSSLTQVEQNALSVAMAGTMQRERFTVLMNNYSKALEYSEVATNSAGNALERYSVYQDSIEAKTNELTAAMESLSTNTISEGLYSGIIEATTGIVEFLDKTNLLKASLAGLVAMGVSKAIASMGAGFITAAKSTAQLSAAMALFDKGTSTANLKRIGHACKGLSDQQLKLVLSTNNLRYSQRLTILEGMGLEEQERKQMLTTLGFVAAEDKATVSTFSLKGAMKSLWATMAANPVGLIVTAVTVATMIFTGFNKAMEEVRQKAKDLGDSFKSTKSEIEDYKSQIEELHKTINDSNSSIEDVTNARQTLMSVQDELIDKFGTEKESIDLITSAINNQSDALDTLTEKQWQAAKNDFNDSVFWNDIANWSQGYDTNIDRMVDEMENVREILSFSYNDVDSKEFQELEQLLKKRGWSYQGTLGGFVKEGHLKEIYSELLEIQMLAEDIEAPDHFLKDLTKDANAAKETLDSYGEMWDNYILNDRVFANEDLADSWHKVNEAYSDYHDAFVSGNQEEIDKSLNDYAELMSNVLNDSDVDESVKEYFRDMYPALQAEVEKWEFHTKILPEYDTYALNGKTKADILGMLQTDGMQSGEQTFNSILDLASEYGIITGDNAEKVQKLLDMLVEWGILQDDINESTAEYAPDAEVSLSISQTIDQLNTQLKPAFDSLKSAYNDIFTDDGFNPNAVDIPMLDSIKSSIEEINELEDVDITIDMDAFDSLATTLTDINTTEEQAKQAFNDFATSIFYATNATDSMTEETKELVEQLLESLGIVNATEVAEYALAEAKAKDMLATYDLINAKESEYVAILADGEAAGITRQQIYKLMAAEIAFGQNDLNTEQKIEQLRNLAKAYGDTASAALATAIANDLASGHTDVDSAINDLMAQVNSGIQKVDIDFSPIEKSASKAGSSAGKSYADALKDELSNLNSVISYIGDVIGDQIDLFEEQKDAAVEALEAEKEAAEEALEAEKELVQEKIDAKQAEIDAIKDAAKARKNELDLQKAQYELEQMQNQKTMLVNYMPDTIVI